MLTSRKEIYPNATSQAFLFFISITIFCSEKSIIFPPQFRYIFLLLFTLVSLILLSNKVNPNVFFINSVMVLPLIIGSFLTPIPTRPLFQTLGAIFYLTLIIWNAFLMINLISLDKKVLILVSKLQSILLLFSIIGFYLKLPYFFLLEDRGGGVFRLTSIIYGDPNFTAMSVLIICFVINALMRTSFQQNLILNVLSIIVVILTGSVSANLYLIIPFLIFVFSYLKNIINKFLLYKKVNFIKFINQNLIKILFGIPILVIVSNKFFLDLKIFGRLYSSFLKIIIENQSSLDSNMIDRLSSYRFSLYGEALDIFNRLPLINKIFGYGITEYLTDITRYIHNTYIEILLEGGLVLLVVFLFLNFRYYTTLFSSGFSPFVKILGTAVNLTFLTLTLFYKIMPITILIGLPLLVNRDLIKNSIRKT